MMGSDHDITLLEDFDTEMLQQEGWSLYRMLQDNIDNAYVVYEKAMKLIEDEQAKEDCELGLRPVTQNDSVFMEIYRKAK